MALPYRGTARYPTTMFTERPATGIDRSAEPIPGRVRGVVASARVRMLWTCCRYLCVVPAAAAGHATGRLSLRALIGVAVAGPLAAAVALLTQHLRDDAGRRRADRYLATGCGRPPDERRLADHRAALTTPRSRRTLAATLRRIAGDAGPPAALPTRPAQFNPHLRRFAGDLRDLADAVETAAAGPAGARGIALVRVLVSDGAGPLYDPRRGGELAAALARARGALVPAA